MAMCTAVQSQCSGDIEPSSPRRQSAIRSRKSQWRYRVLSPDGSPMGILGDTDPSFPASTGRVLITRTKFPCDLRMNSAQS
jgi:hypothetical protein